jgi:flagellar biosynthesis/type III secretory pathway ATPase
MSGARIIRLSGALAEATPLRGVSLYELVRVGTRGLLGEVVRVEGERGVIQVYEDTTGLCIGEPVAPTGAPLTVTLGPGLLFRRGGRATARGTRCRERRLHPSRLAADTLDATRWPFVQRRAPATSGGRTCHEWRSVPPSCTVSSCRRT